MKHTQNVEANHPEKARNQNLQELFLVWDAIFFKTFISPGYPCFALVLMFTPNHENIWECKASLCFRELEQGYMNASHKSIPE